MIQFELVSPEKKLISEPIAMAVIPGEDGELGVGEKHASFVVSLKSGVLKLYRDSMNDQPLHIFIAGGFADITGENCTVLAEEAINVSDIDAAELNKQKKTIEHDLGLAEEQSDKNRYQRHLNLINAKLDAVARAA